MRKHNRRLYRVARSLLRDDAEAEDALQEAYICAYRALGDFRGEAQLATWLTRIVVNECMTRLRRSARRDNIIPIVSAPVRSEQEEDAMAQQASRDDTDAPDAALVRAEIAGAARTQDRRAAAGLSRGVRDAIGGGAERGGNRRVPGHHGGDGAHAPLPRAQPAARVDRAGARRGRTRRVQLRRGALRPDRVACARADFPVEPLIAGTAQLSA